MLPLKTDHLPGSHRKLANLAVYVILCDKNVMKYYIICSNLEILEIRVFRYNRFWHFWFQLNNHHYFRAFLASLVISSILVPAAVLFSPLWALVVAVPLVVAGTIVLFTQLSNFFYNRQNQRLDQLKANNTDEVLKEKIDLYLNRRVVCPEELFAETNLNFPLNTPKMNNAVASTPLMLETEDTLRITKVSNDIYRRNSAIKATSESNHLYIKTVAAKDGLSEVAAREMAEILGFGGLIPLNTITGINVLHNHEINSPIPNAGLILSRQKIKELIDERIKESPKSNIKNSPNVQNAVAKFVFNLKTAAYRTKAKKEEQFSLLHIQKFFLNVVDGLQVYTLLFNEPVVLPGQLVLGGLTKSQKRNQRAQAKQIIDKISLPSFQENFLLHLILGSQDANPGNTLFSDGPNDTVLLHSIDHERIMPEDNYNVTKKIPLANGTNLTGITDKDIKNVFPVRLWLAGLPQANVPFTKEVIKKTLDSLSFERLFAYHQHKKLFSSAAVGSQLDRMLLIKNEFEEEIKKSEITLTPKQLFIKFINNHPTFIFLNKLQLSELSIFMLLGQIPEGSDMSLLRHPLQWFSMTGMIKEAAQNEQQGLPPFSKKSFESSHAHNVLFFSLANQQKMVEEENKAGLDILSETTAHLTSC